MCNAAQECVPDTIIWVPQGGAKAEDMGEGSIPGRPHRVLLVTVSKLKPEV